MIATSNLFGDVLADLGAVLLASRGLSFSGNFSQDGAAVYQTNHGSALDLADQGRANPIGQISSLGMMLRESFGLVREAAWIEAAIAEVLRLGFRTFDVAEASDDARRHGGDGKPHRRLGPDAGAARRMRPVLLLVDLQNDFLDAPGLEPAGAEVVRQAARLLDGRAGPRRARGPRRDLGRPRGGRPHAALEGPRARGAACAARGAMPLHPSSRRRRRGGRVEDLLFRVLLA